MRLQPDGRLLVQGVAADDGDLQFVSVNGQKARSVAFNYSQWEVLLEGADARAPSVVACAQDAAGNTELTPHKIDLR